MSAEEMVSLFLDNAARAAAGISRVAGSEAVARKVLELAPKGADVFCPGQTGLEREIAALLQNRVADYGQAQVSVEEVSAALAETGSIICTSAEGKAVQSSLLPEYHIAIVPREKIFATLDDFFAVCADAPPTNITIITGPSRTGDIEMNLVVGVHGPEKLDVIVV